MCYNSIGMDRRGKVRPGYGGEADGGKPPRVEVIFEDGDMIEVYNDRGTVRIPAFVTDRIIRGAVALSQGGWYTPGKDGVDVRGSINVLTYTYKPSPVAKGNPQHTNLVEVKRCLTE